MGIRRTFGPATRANAHGREGMRAFIGDLRGQVFPLAQPVTVVKRVRH